MRDTGIFRGHAGVAWLAAATLGAVGCYQGVPYGADANPEYPETGPNAGDGTDGSDDEEETDGTGGPEAGQDCDAEAVWAVDVLTTNCEACHNAGNPQGNFDYVTDLARLVTSGKLVPGDPQGSPLFSRVSSGTMPPTGALPDDTVSRLSDYVEFCANDPQPQCGDNDPIDTFDQLQIMVDDLATVDVDDRPFTRYFTLTHLHNTGHCDEDLDIYRSAMAKLINSLSTGPSIVAPLAIDEFETIYRIDLRDYEWDEPVGEFENKWEALINAAPYSVERLEDTAETIKLFTGTAVPALLGDAFIEIASQPPLYHDLAGVPERLQELEIQLGVDIQANVDDEEVARAGVLDSGVSRQNRVIERHDIPLGFGRALWFSYDFQDDSEVAQNIFASPLDFEAAGGEVIFSLPNGMHAYMLTDAAGNRLDVAPDVIVVDPSQEDQNVRNGISCFGCHAGLIPAVDEVRDHVLLGVEFDAQTKDTVSAIYPEASEFQSLVDADTQRLHNAHVASGVQLDLPLEPVAEAFARFRFNVDLDLAAAELGVSPETLVTQLGGLDPSLGALATSSVKRDTWAALFAQTVCELNLGNADDEACSDTPSSGNDGSDSDGGTGGEDDSPGDGGSTGTPGTDENTSY